MRALCFLENGRLYGHDSSVFFREFTFFGQNMGMRAVIFLLKIGKKGHPIDFFWPINIEYSFDRIYVFLTKYGHDRRGF